jgi:hypothetical protein
VPAETRSSSFAESPPNSGKFRRKSCAFTEDPVTAKWSFPGRWAF